MKSVVLNASSQPQFTCSLFLIAKGPTIVAMLGGVGSFKSQNLGKVSHGSRCVLIWGGRWLSLKPSLNQMGHIFILPGKGTAHNLD